MKTELLLEAVGLLDDKYVEEFVRRDQTAKKRLRTKRICSALAACLCVAVLAGAAWRAFEPAIWPYTPTGEPWRPKFGSFVEEMTLDASQLPPAPIQSSIKGDADTSLYNIVFAPSIEHLGLAPLPETDYLPIYQFVPAEQSEREANKFIKTYSGVASTLFGIDCTDGKKQENTTEFQDGDRSVRFVTSSGNFNLFRYCTQERDSSELSYYLQLNGNYIHLIQTDTDEQIKEKLAETISFIGEAFDTDFPDIKIVREYDGLSLNKLTVYLYEAQKTAFPDQFKSHPMVSRFVELTFLAVPGREGIYPCDGFEYTRGLSILQGFTFYETIESWSDYYQVIGKSRMISPDEAVALLESGYEPHSACPICDKLNREYQKPIDFTDYDAIELIYLSKDGIYIPFYAIYEYHSDMLLNEKARLFFSYAVTYVPAVEVENIEVYFD